MLEQTDRHIDTHHTGAHCLEQLLERSDAPAGDHAPRLTRRSNPPTSASVDPNYAGQQATVTSFLRCALDYKPVRSERATHTGPAPCHARALTEGPVGGRMLIVLAIADAHLNAEDTTMTTRKDILQICGIKA